MFLSDLWNTYLFENRNERVCEMQSAVKKTEASLNKLISTLNEEQRALLEEYEENINELSGYSSEKAFEKGIRFATKFLLDALAEPPL
ncbi:MAG: hypothetical protein IJN09_07665 [Oscillospiraceae bacterium]|nr:hypothetical protein [Oscillospiraceae bacterium]MBQ6698906.1 hypothetical protein [Oscillospiraceae bacterium]